MKTKALAFMLAVTGMAACSNSRDLYDPDLVERDLKQTYNSNFKAKYPNVDLNQDYSYGPNTVVYDFATAAKSPTRAGGEAADVVTEVGSDWYTTDDNLLSWMKAELKEKEDNSSKGYPFTMNAPGNEFTIVPIYQGKAGAAWDLHLVIEGQDIRLWGKSENMEKSSDNVNWKKIDNSENGGDLSNAAYVRTKPITIKNVPQGASMYLYLKVTRGSSGWTNLGDVYSSVENYMVALNCTERPAGLPEDYQSMIIGCEDSRNDKAANCQTDNDFNDVVFLVYGKPYMPQPIKIEEGFVKSTTVRYMMEDLGATDDFDFNDIVVDVTEKVQMKKITVGETITFEEGEKSQSATIRHLGGTLPFTLKIGDTVLPERQGMLDVDLEETFPVSGWSRELHNVSLSVKELNSNGVHNISFPKAGEAPMIIRTDITQQWMPERQSVPSSWFYVPAPATGEE